MPEGGGPGYWVCQQSRRRRTIMFLSRGPREGRMARKREVGVVTQLRQYIRGSGESLASLARRCGVGPDRLSRFMRGERDLTFAAAEKVCLALGLRLVPAKGKGNKP